MTNKPRFSLVIFEFREALTAGSRPSIKEYLERYPEYAERLAPVLAALCEQVDDTPLDDQEIRTIQQRILPRLRAFWLTTVEQTDSANCCINTAASDDGEQSPLPRNTARQAASITPNGTPRTSDGIRSDFACAAYGSPDHQGQARLGDTVKQPVFGDLVELYLQVKRGIEELCSKELGLTLETFRTLRNDTTPVAQLRDNTVLQVLALRYRIPIFVFPRIVSKVQATIQCVSANGPQVVLTRSNDLSSEGDMGQLRARLIESLTGGEARNAQMANQTRERS